MKIIIIMSFIGLIRCCKLVALVYLYRAVRIKEPEPIQLIQLLLVNPTETNEWQFKVRLSLYSKKTSTNYVLSNMSKNHQNFVKLTKRNLIVTVFENEL